MSEQLAHLAQASALPNVSIQVLTFGAGAHAGMDGKFNLLSFPDPDDPDLVYLEMSGSGLMPEDPEEIRRYTLMFGTLAGKALSPEQSAAFIRSIAGSKP
jgi:hypothetical protein